MFVTSIIKPKFFWDSSRENGIYSLPETPTVEFPVLSGFFEDPERAGWRNYLI